MGTLIGVGNPLPKWSGPLPQAGSNLIMNYCGAPFLMLFLDQPTSPEARGVRKGEIKFGLLPVSQHTFFLIYNIPSVTSGWGDASYGLGLLAPGNRDIAKRDSERGWLFTILLADCNSGIAHAMRAATISPRFSNILDELIEDQRKNLATFSKEKHLADIDAAYLKYPNADAMVRDAIIVEKIGIGFRGT